jgi:hypothetical protein
MRRFTIPLTCSSIGRRRRSIEDRVREVGQVAGERARGLDDLGEVAGERSSVLDVRGNGRVGPVDGEIGDGLHRQGIQIRCPRPQTLGQLT